jgi:hypothetical protein
VDRIRIESKFYSFLTWFYRKDRIKLLKDHGSRPLLLLDLHVRSTCVTDSGIFEIVEN